MPTRYHLRRDEHAVGDPARFSTETAAQIEGNPHVVVDTIDEALDVLYRWIAETHKRHSDPAEAARRSGLVTDEDWRSRRESSAFNLHHGVMAGRVCAIGGGRVMHVHALPVTTR